MLIVSEDINVNYKNVLLAYLKALDSDLSVLDLSKISFKNKADKLVSELIQNYLIKLESISPGSAELFLNLMNDKNIISSAPTLFNLEDMKQLLRTYADEETCEIVSESLKLSGLFGKVVIGNHVPECTKDIMELSYGSFFHDMDSAIKIKNSKFLYPKVVVIDGYVESSSELHRLFEDANRLKETVFLFIRGISEDVKHTIKINNDRGSFCVVPIVSKYDIKSANILNDVAIVSGVDVVSSLKGQLISTIDISATSRVDSIVVNESGVLIENKRTNKYVDQHIHFLQCKVNNAGSDAEIDVISDRIKNLGSNRVTLYLKNDHDRLKRTFMIDQCLRAVKISSTYGVVKVKNKTYPFPSIKAALHYQQKIKDLFDNVGCLVCN